MTLLSPAFLWAFAALLPLAAVYWLKVRPRRKPTTAIFLWDRVFSEKRATTLFQRLRDVISLLLMMLAVAALVLAMAQPQLAGDQRRDLLLLIDRSASMATEEGGETRLERAKDEARAIVRALNGSQRAAIASLADEVVYHTQLTRDPRRLNEAIDGIEQTMAAVRAESLAELSGRDDWAEDYRVVLISDGVLGGETAEGEAGEADASPLAQDIELLKVGAAAENVGIVAADLKRLPSGPQALGLWVKLASTFDEPVEADLIVQRNGVLQRVLPVVIEPGVNDAMVLDLQGDAGAWQVTVDLADAFAADDDAYLALGERSPVRVGVSARDQYFFQHSVLAFGQAEGTLELVPGDDADVVLSQGEAVDAPLTVVFEPQGESPLWPELGEPLGQVVPRVLVEDHPALRFLEVENMAFAGARQVEAPPGAVVLVESVDGVPLMWQVRSDDRATLVVNLSPREGEFFFSPQFPVLVHGMVTHLTRRTESLRATYRPGATVPIPGGDEGVQTQVLSPGAEETTGVYGERLGPLDRIGFFELTNESGRWLVGSSVASLGETLVNPPEREPRLDPLSRGWPPSSLLLLLAIVVLVAESFLYHRRKVG